MAYEDHIIDCTVRINRGNQVLGTAFFVAKGIVATCFHVIKADYTKPLLLQYKGKEYFSSEVRITENKETTDVALIYFSDLPDTHAVVLLSKEIKYGEDVWAYGFTEKYYNGKPAKLIYEGPAKENITLYQFAHGEAPSGLSGSPVANLRTSSVCAILKRTRDLSNDLGGYGIPIETLFAEFPDIQALNKKANEENSGLTIFQPTLHKETNHSWKEACLKMLERQKELSSNPFTQIDGNRFNLDDVFTPLSLTGRLSRAKTTPIMTEDESDQLLANKYVFSDQVFLNSVTKVSWKSERIDGYLREEQNKSRTAIVGSPGSGKTTLLQHIAWYAIRETKILPIWVSLANLQEKSLQSFLLEEWCKDALLLPESNKEIQQSFVSLFTGGQILLLLDGLDEMPMSAAEKHIQRLHQQLHGWLAEANIILTSRTQTWDNVSNKLTGFNIYRTLPFNFGEARGFNQVGDFIDSWFKSNTNLARSLKIELNKSENLRIRSAVGSPLLLTVVCNIWSKRQGMLPATKVGLYEQFIDIVYDWKQSHNNEIGKEILFRRKMSRLLGKVALTALDHETPQYRLTHPILPESSDDEDWAYLDTALQTGLIIPTGIAAEDPEKKTYSFFHTSFQEYFAALAIEDETFFLEEGLGDPNQGHFRIFNPQWIGTVQLWMGFATGRQLRERLLQALFNFKDGCGGFYKDQALLIGAFLKEELPGWEDSQLATLPLYNWAFGINFSFNETSGIIPNWVEYFTVLKEAALNRLENSYSEDSIELMLDLWHKTLDFNNQKRVFLISSVIKVMAKNNGKAIRYFKTLLDDWNKKIAAKKLSHDNQIYREVLECLLEIGLANEGAILTIIDVFKASPKEKYGIRYSVINKLINLSENDQPGSDCLVHLMANEISYNELVEFKVRRFADTAVDRKVKEAVANKLYDDERWQSDINVIETLANIQPGDGRPIFALLKILKSSPSPELEEDAIQALGKYAKGNDDVFRYLMDKRGSVAAAFLEGRGDRYMLINVTVALLSICPKAQSNPEWLGFLLSDEVKALLQKLDLAETDSFNASNDQAFYQFYSYMFRRLEDMGYFPENCIGQLLAGLTHSDETVRLYAARMLVKNNIFSEAIEHALVNLLGTSKNPESRRRETPFNAASELHENFPGSEAAIEKAIELINAGDYETTRLAFGLLSRVGSGNWKALQFLMSYPINKQDDRMLSEKVYAISSIGLSDGAILSNLIAWFDKVNYPRGVLETLGKLGVGNTEVIDFFLSIVVGGSGEDTYRRETISHLEVVAAGNKKAILMLADIFMTEMEPKLLRPLANAIVAMMHDDVCVLIVKKIKLLYEKADDFERRDLCHSILWECSQRLSYPEFYLAWNENSDQTNEPFLT